MVQPVFLISLPRSGSTLLQKVLAAHSCIGSAAEPWVLLPLAAMTGEVNGPVYSEYSHTEAVLAMNDLIAASHGGHDRYYASVAQWLRGLYGDCLPEGKRYFLDKTPRYYLIVDYIYRLFPDAKVIFLCRNPLEALASMMTTWWSGTLKTYHLELDLREGPEHMASAYRRHAKRAHAVHYRDLVERPEETVQAICRYLDLPFEGAMIAGYQSSRFDGVMGDPVGVHRYAGISTEPLEKWVGVLNNPVRRHYARSLLRAYSAEVREFFRLDVEALSGALDRAPSSPRALLQDGFWLLASWVARHLAADAVRGQLARTRPYKVN